MTPLDAVRTAFISTLAGTCEHNEERVARACNIGFDDTGPAHEAAITLALLNFTRIPSPFYGFGRQAARKGGFLVF